MASFPFPVIPQHSSLYLYLYLLSIPLSVLYSQYTPYSILSTGIDALVCIYPILCSILVYCASMIPALPGFG